MHASPEPPLVVAPTEGDVLHALRRHLGALAPIRWAEARAAAELPPGPLTPRTLARAVDALASLGGERERLVAMSFQLRLRRFRLESGAHAAVRG